jgi:zeaxanthin glucosyltransferase
MAHFAVLAPPLTGHFKPLAALARELSARGHRATFVHLPEAEAVARRHGATFAALKGGSLSEHRGVFGTVREMVRQTDAICRYAPDLLGRIGVDAVIADQLEPAGGLVAEHLGLPFASVATALPVNRELGIPPPYVGWPFDPSPRGLWWAQGGWKVADALMRRHFDAIARNAQALGLRPHRTLDDCLSPVLQLAQAVPGVDFPRKELPSGFHYVGPMRDPPDPSLDFGLDFGERRDRPLVFCSLGTLQGGRLKLFRSTARACADLGWRLVITHCGRLDRRDVERLPGNPMVFDYLPQEAALQQTDVVVTHAGFNTVLETLACGLPMVALPIAFDQPAVAARITRAGVGRVVNRRCAGAGQLRNALDTVLRDPSYRRNARKVQTEIAAAGGVRRAADLIETHLALRPERLEVSTRADAAAGDVHGDNRSDNR